MIFMKTVDGQGLRESDLVPHQHQWVADADAVADESVERRPLHRRGEG